MAVDIDLLRSLISLQDLAESGTRNLSSSVRGQAIDYTAPYEQQLLAHRQQLNNWEAVQENKTPTDAYSNTAAYDNFSANRANWIQHLTGANNTNVYQGPAWYSQQPNYSDDVYGYGFDGLKNSSSGPARYVSNHYTNIPEAAKAFDLSNRDATTANPGFMARPNYTATGTVVTDAAPVVPTLSDTFMASSPTSVGKALDKGIRSQQENLRAIALGKGDMSDLKYAKRNIGTARDIKDEVVEYGRNYADTVSRDLVNAPISNYRNQVAALGNKTHRETTSEAANSQARDYDKNADTSQQYLNNAINGMAYTPMTFINSSGGGVYGNASSVAQQLANAAATNPGSLNRTISYNPYQTLKNNLGQPGNFINLPTMPTFNVSDAPEYTSQIDTRWLEKQRRKKKVEALTRS